ncbi:MAG: hypothetical protein ABI278_05710 [Candidatus Aquilonibacter sp.]
MTTALRIDWRRIVPEAVAAGVAGAILLHLYLWLTVLLPAHSSIFSYWQWIASVSLGKIALTSSGYAWIGLLVHLVVGIAWAGGYAFLATQRQFVNRRWVVSGLVYGVVVYIFMQLILFSANRFTFPATPNAFINDVIANAVFFGLPVAYVVSRMTRKSAV